MLLIDVKLNQGKGCHRVIICTADEHITLECRKKEYEESGLRQYITPTYRLRTATQFNTESLDAIKKYGAGVRCYEEPDVQMLFDHLKQFRFICVSDIETLEALQSGIKTSAVEFKVRRSEPSSSKCIEWLMSRSEFSTSIIEKSIAQSPVHRPFSRSLTLSHVPENQDDRRLLVEEEVGVDIALRHQRDNNDSIEMLSQDELVAKIKELEGALEEQSAPADLRDTSSKAGVVSHLLSSFPGMPHSSVMPKNPLISTNLQSENSQATQLTNAVRPSQLSISAKSVPTRIGNTLTTSDDSVHSVDSGVCPDVHDAIHQPLTAERPSTAPPHIPAMFGPIRDDDKNSPSINRPKRTSTPSGDSSTSDKMVTAPSMPVQSYLSTHVSQQTPGVTSLQSAQAVVEEQSGSSHIDNAVGVNNDVPCNIYVNVQQSGVIIYTARWCAAYLIKLPGDNLKKLETLLPWVPQ